MYYIFAMGVNEGLEFSDIHEWRKWLEKNHDIKTEAWLVIHKKRSKQIGIKYDEALTEALCFGWIDGKMKTVDNSRFILRFSPRKSHSVWSKINKDKAEQLISQGRMTEVGLARINEAKKNGNWDNAYTNKIREQIPSDLKQALIENMAALRNFESFTNSYRNMYISWINGTKNALTRKKRIAEVVERSASNVKPGIE
jgi:uncharacterized protein YdeI (YjbR/CyaY-like superfamily)